MRRTSDGVSRMGSWSIVYVTSGKPRNIAGYVEADLLRLIFLSPVMGKISEK
jgi:hypothetical protein